MSDSDWSAPETEVLQRVRAILDGDGRGVLATIIDVDGSAYRRPGAKMVVPEGEAAAGHITAGCLEDEVERLASEVLAAGEPRIETYDLRPEGDDDVWGLGVGCNGVLDVLLEPIDDSYRPVVDAVAAGRPIAVATVIGTTDGGDPAGETDGDGAEAEGGDTDVPLGARAYYDPTEATFTLDEAFPAGVAERLRGAAADLVAQGASDTLSVDGLSVFVDGLVPADDLVVVGTGNDVRPITELGKRAGFRVTVVGFRGANATAERFPAADEVLSTSPARIAETVEFDADTYVVVATHNFVDDRLAIDELLRTEAPYVGLMGPRERFEEMLDDVHDEGREFSSAELDRLYTPVGLDLGGGTPNQVALSIVGEALAVSNDRTPGHLKEREGTIHGRVERSVGGSD